MGTAPWAAWLLSWLDGVDLVLVPAVRLSCDTWGKLQEVARPCCLCTYHESHAHRNISCGEDVERWLQRVPCVWLSPVTSRCYGLFQPHMMCPGAPSFWKCPATATPASVPLEALPGRPCFSLPLVALGGGVWSKQPENVTVPKPKWQPIKGFGIFQLSRSEAQMFTVSKSW